ncbi:hypothetical protein J2782_002779 [Brucella pseudogrignonensis]|uniref:Uncharacterized protein n=1 Tax=Brucella pseudogrignonensis TaxID=419475 RepID=A0ABU1MAH8_9HYPH|nr:hypothetical protein [Brucella pseudogrignonensis]
MTPSYGFFDKADSGYASDFLSIWIILLTKMLVELCVLFNFTYICCHSYGVPLGTAREERSLL